jgi:uncharacterized protein
VDDLSPKAPALDLAGPAAALARIAAALERISAPPLSGLDLSAAQAFVWRPAGNGLAPIDAPQRIPLDLILEAERQRDALRANTDRFAAGSPANNALLWGARGTGKSALVKAVHAAVAAKQPQLKLIEVSSDDLHTVPRLVAALAAAPERVILFIDDLSFDGDESAARALKPALDGGIAARPENLVVYATSNRRHLVPRDPRENAADDLIWADTAEERLAMADRFGLWLGFHALDQDGYLRIVRAYAKRLALPIAPKELEREALAWSRLRAARSGRTAWQFILDLAGALGKPVKL